MHNRCLKMKALPAMLMALAAFSALAEAPPVINETWTAEQARPVTSASYTPVGVIAPNITLKEAAQAALLKNPEVQARWHAFLEADAERSVARGAFFPRVDASYGSGREKIRQNNVVTDLDFGRHETIYTLRQMLFDGFGTYNEVKRLGKASLVRYFELLDASENIALEAARAYMDVVRYRYQVFLAEENYIQHHAALEQLRKRAESGVGKRVDVDQAASRLALADVNLTTSYANLHDVSARYMRIVGEQPAKVMYAPAELSKGMPDTADAALAAALKNNPALRASIENIEAAQYDLAARRSAFMPRIDFVARKEHNSNYQDEGSRDNSFVGFQANWNLFSGGSDVARLKQYRERKNVALDLREKACRDIRQTLAIAYNDTSRLNDQLSFIGIQVNLVEKTRAAYRDQFNIGQRTLLDLLNTQNEYFDARRSQVNADVDLTMAYFRSYAGMGRLLDTLELKRPEPESRPDASDFTAVDLAQMCPPVAPTDTTLDREDLGRKAKEMMEGSSNSFIGGRSPRALVPSAEPAVKPGQPGAVDAEISSRTKAWAAAWAARDVKGYLAFYAPGFVPEGGVSRAAWEKQRRQRIENANGIRLEIKDLAIRQSTQETVIVAFRQMYSTEAFADTSDKALEWRKENGQWLIVSERVQVVRGQ